MTARTNEFHELAEFVDAIHQDSMFLSLSLIQTWDNPRHCQRVSTQAFGCGCAIARSCDKSRRLTLLMLCIGMNSQSLLGICAPMLLRAPSAPVFETRREAPLLCLSKQNMTKQRPQDNWAYPFCQRFF